MQKQFDSHFLVNLGYLVAFVAQWVIDVWPGIPSDAIQRIDLLHICPFFIFKCLLI